MKKLETKELLEVEGGAISFQMTGLITGIISGIAVFVAGIFNGYMNSKACK